MNSYGKMKNSLRAMSVRKFSDKEPATVQDYGTRKEMKENEQNIQKGLCYIQIAIGSFKTDILHRYIFSAD